MLVLLIVALTPAIFADIFYLLTNSSQIPEIYARRGTVTYKGGVTRISLNVRRQSHTIAVGRGQPLKFTVGVRHLCTHVDLITFYIEDYFGPKKSSLLDNRYGLDFVWRQLGNRFEVHQRNRDASSQVVDLQWPAGKPGGETKANVTVDDRGNVKVQHRGAADSATICHPGTQDPCSFTRHNYTGDLDAFELEIVTINDLKCGLFVELDDQSGRLLFHPSGDPTTGGTTSPVVDSSTVSSGLVSSYSSTDSVSNTGSADLGSSSTRSANVSTLPLSAATGENRKTTDSSGGDKFPAPTRNVGSQDTCSLLMVVACVCISTVLPFLRSSTDDIKSSMRSLRRPSQ